VRASRQAPLAFQRGACYLHLHRPPLMRLKVHLQPSLQKSPRPSNCRFSRSRKISRPKNSRSRLTRQSEPTRLLRKSRKKSHLLTRPRSLSSASRCARTWWRLTCKKAAHTLRTSGRTCSLKPSFSDLRSYSTTCTTKTTLSTNLSRSMASAQTTSPS